MSLGIRSGSEDLASFGNVTRAELGRGVSETGDDGGVIEWSKAVLRGLLIDFTARSVTSLVDSILAIFALSANL